MKRAARVVLPVLAILGLSFSQAWGASTVVFNNLGPNDIYSYQGHFIGDAGFGFTVAIAGNFHPSQSGNLEELWLAIMIPSTRSDPFTLSLAADNAGLPGAVLWNQAVPTAGHASDWGSLLHLDGIHGPTLDAGGSYWITAQVTSSPDQWVNWCNNGYNQLGGVAESRDGGPWVLGDFTPAMKIGVVPEPSTFVLLGMSVFALFGVWRRSRKTVC
jgi:hypothetical protein